ncbi:hypothetical protein HVY71_22975 [Citrobacter freundii]|nr:hypothetical protein HVY71_22975 [Citrobacter freundii]HCT4277549.1 hypothetical protein [Citrobacter freundii]
MSDKELRKDPYVIAEKYGYIEGENGSAYIAFVFPQELAIPPTDRLFVGMELDDIEGLALILQDHVNRNRKS